MSQVIKEEGWNQVKSKTKAKAQAMKEQAPEKKSRSGRSITSSVRDSSGCTVRDCKQDAADDKRAGGRGRITGQSEWADNEAGEPERERDQRRCGGVAVVITVAVAVTVARVNSEWLWCVVIIRRGGSRQRAMLGKTGRGEGSGRAARGGAHEVQWGEAVSDVV